MKKKIALGLISVAAIVAGVAAFSAYEAHVINVTAHIENALYVHPEAIDFGTVFPQEYKERNFTVRMSDSFQTEERVDDIEYVIKQKPKCKCIYDPIDEPDGFDIDCEGEMYTPVDYATHECPEYYRQMLSLCPFLSKMDGDPEDNNDTSHPSYYNNGVDGIPGTEDDFCEPTPFPDATGMLWKHDIADFVDLWILDLKVPPVDGFVGQDWPEGCPTVDENDMDYGCDLWIEVTNISKMR